MTIFVRPAYSSRVAKVLVSELQRCSSGNLGAEKAEADDMTSIGKLLFGTQFALWADYSQVGLRDLSL